MGKTVFTKQNAWTFLKDFFSINLGMAVYSFGWAVFLLPYKIPTGGMAGLAAIFQYASGFPMQYSILMANAILLMLAWWQLGPKFALKTAYAVVAMSFYLQLGQDVMTDSGGELLKVLDEGQDSMACILGAIFNGLGIGLVFLAGGSTGGWDIVAALVNKYRNISLGRVMLYLDFFVIALCWPLFHEWRMVVFGYVTLFIYTFSFDMLLNSSRQDVQFTIYSVEHEKLCAEISKQTGHTMTLMVGEGGYTHQGMKVIVVVVHKRETIKVLRLIHAIDPAAFVTQHRVEGAYGLGFNAIKP